MKFIATAKGGRLTLNSDFNKSRLNEDIRTNEGARYRIERETPESKEQRGFYHGGVLALWAFLDGNDHRDNNIIEHYHHEAKKEFNGDVLIRNGKKEKYGKSTKGILNHGYLNKIIDFLEEQYGIKREKVLDPKRYKEWRDTIYPFSDSADNYIDYLVECGELKLT